MKSASSTARPVWPGSAHPVRQREASHEGHDLLLGGGEHRGLLGPADGRQDPQRLADAARALAHKTVLFDMEAVTTQAGTVISAVMFGALAGAGVLPWPRSVCEAQSSVQPPKRAWRRCSGAP